MRTVALSTGPLAYVEQGAGPPLVLLHANPGDRRDYDAVIPTLAERFRVMALDWPGYGESMAPADVEAVSIPWLVEVLREFLDALALSSVILVGNSIGGTVAARLALASPERVQALVLVAPGGFTPHTWLTRRFCAWQGSRWSLPPALFARLYLHRRTPTVRAMLDRAATIQSTPTRRALNRALWRRFVLPESDLREAARACSTPTLLLFGTRDPTIPAARDGAVAARTVPGASFVALPCGHAPFAELPDRFLAEVEAFLCPGVEGIASMDGPSRVATAPTPPPHSPVDHPRP